MLSDKKILKVQQIPIVVAVLVVAVGRWNDNMFGRKCQLVGQIAPSNNHKSRRRPDRAIRSSLNSLVLIPAGVTVGIDPPL